MLIKTREALKHIDTLSPQIVDPEIQQLLTQHLVVLAVAESEEEIEAEIIHFFSTSGFSAAESLARSCLGVLLRSIKTGEIAGFLERLGNDHKTRFLLHIDTDQAMGTAFNNLIINRHSIVHEARCNLTLREFRNSLMAIDFVLEGVRRSL